MKYDIASGIVTADASYLASFAYKRPLNSSRTSSADGFHKVYSDTDINVTVEENVAVNGEFELPVGTLRVTSYADRVFTSSDSITLEVLKPSNKLPYGFMSSYNSELLAFGAVTAYLYCRTFNVSSLVLRLTFVKKDTGETSSFERVYSSDVLCRLTDALVKRAEPFICIFVEQNGIRNDEIRRLSFPYKDIRSGQHELMLGIMKTVRRGGKLVASAPTGTGKTMASIYPAIKALGAGLTDKIFYLTGKGVTGKAAFDAMALLSQSAPHLRCITVRAKETCCISGNYPDGCRMCPRMLDAVSEGRTLTYKQRVNDALSELLTARRLYDTKSITETAKKFDLCPYELSLDVSEFCDLIICDYNYVFDSKVRFRRYFNGEGDKKYTFLIDEAHNLPDRVRASYSAEFSPYMTEKARQALGEDIESYPEVSDALELCRDAFDEIRSLCFEESRFYVDKTGEHKAGYYKSDKVPELLISAAAAVVESFRERARREDEKHEAYSDLYGAASALLNCASEAVGGFAFLGEACDDKLTCKLICLDPSEIISASSSYADAVVMFSATLDPIDYFVDILGCKDAQVLKAESPFDPNNMCVTIFDGVSTRYADRRETAYDIAEVILNVLEAKAGHYFVFFPSYKYMRTVAKALLEIDPTLTAVMQKPSMSYADREKFLGAFNSQKYERIVGLCVLGGVFSEGVDLVGDSLIGTVVVGAGLAGISSELNLMSEYFEEKYGAGHLYAYEYPAVNRIEQAAGRVIRTAEDRGVVVLIDDRLSSRDMASRFPDFWPQISCTSDIRTLCLILERFWNEN